ncbi:MAG: peroxiredoxin-like family protein, partial [Thermoanaerobaculia bacterium]
SEVEEGAEILDQYWPGARAVSDPERQFYRAFGLHRGSFNQLLGPRVVWAAAKSAMKGNAPGRAQGDVRTMPGMFLVRDGEIVWQHEFRFSGDHPDLGDVAGVAARIDAE